MKQGREFADLVFEIEDQAKRKNDFLVNSDMIEMHEYKGSMLLEIADWPAPYRIGDVAHGQIAKRLRIPAGYYFRMKEEAPDLLAENVNRWLWENPQPRMIRTEGTRARAFLSDRYQRWDNRELIHAIQATLQQEEAQVASSELTNTRFYLKVLTPRLEAEIRKGDVVQAGAAIINSEVGYNHLEVLPFLNRCSCDNGMVVQDPAFDQRYQIRHIGPKRESGIAAGFLLPPEDQERTAAFFSSVQERITKALDFSTFQRATEQLKRGTRQAIKADPKDVVTERLAKAYELNQKVASEIYFYLVADKDYTQYGLTNAITRASRDIKDYDRATEIERLGGKIAALGPDKWTALAA